MGLSTAVPVIIGAIKTAGAWAVKQGAQLAAREGVKLAAKEAGKAVIGAAVAKGVEKITEKDAPEPQTFDENAANRKAATKAAFGARKRIAQQTTTLLTSPVATLGGVARGAAKTLLGQ